MLQAPPSGRVLGFAVAEGPVFLLYLDEVYEDVFPPEPDSRVKAIRDGFVERLFLIDRAALVPGDLDDHEILAAADAEIIGIEQEVPGLVRGDNLEAIVIGHPHAEERVIDDAADLLTVGRALRVTKRPTS